MTTGMTPNDPRIGADAPEPSWRGAVRRMMRNPLAAGALAVICVVVAASVLAPLITSADPTTSNLGDVLLPAGADGHPLGTDGLGRDVLSRLVYGARSSLLGGLVAVLVAVAVGVSSGLLAGYHLGRVDLAANWVANGIISLPAMVVLLVVISVIGPRMVLVMAVFGLLISPGFFRITRAATMKTRAELYVDAAKVNGLSDSRIIARHVLPVVRAPIIIQASLMVGLGIAVQQGLTFLGLGSQNDVSWGAMINDGFANIYAAPALIYPPGVAIASTVAAFAVLGSALRDVLGRSDSVSGREPAADDDAGESRDGVPTDGEIALAVRGLTVDYPAGSGHREVVHDVSVGVRKGEMLCLVGESGSGKTQTAFAMLGLLPGNAGVRWEALTVAGAEIPPGDRKALARLRGQRVAYVPQEPMSNLDPSFKIGFQIAEPMRRHRGMSRAVARDRARDLLTRVGIADPDRVLDSYPHQVSGGMAQRVLIAIAISCDPEVLIADEPTIALDVTVQAEVLDLLRELQRETGMALLMVTHNFGVVADLADRVAVMRDGRLVEVADVATAFASPQHPYTRMLLDSTLEGKPPRQALLGKEAR